MRRSFTSVLIITLLLQTVVYALRPMVSYKDLSIGANAFDLGGIASSFAGLSLLVAVSIGRWVDRWGEPRFVLAGAAVISASCLSLIWIDSVWALAVNQAFLGLGHILSVVSGQTLVANRGDPTQRTSRFGVFTVFVSLGQLIGPAAAGLLAGNAISTAVNGAGEGEVGTDKVFIASAALTVLATVVALALLRSGGSTRQGAPGGSTSHQPTAGPPSSYWKSIGRVMSVKSMPHAMFASLTVITSIDILSAYLPAYAEARGIPVETVGLLLAARAAASMASRLLMIPLLKLLQPPHLLALSTMLPAVALATFPFIDGRPTMYAFMALAGFGLGLGQPVTLSWVAGRAPSDIRGTALGIRLTGNRLGQTVLPAAIGVVAGISSVTAVFGALASLLGLSTAAVLTAEFSDETPPG